ncbi:carboxymuconolactone decarboxylase family protein [Labilithrix luteola]|nr:carboxymuconolactone decarboxylase family protein [Labilithrix luteola]
MARIDYAKVAPEALKALVQLEGHVRKSGLDRKLKDLVYLRVSQINGCAYCIDMHSKDLRAHGETDERMHLLPVFREVSAMFSERERAALAWAESVTLLTEGHVPDEVFEEARQHFEERELVELTMAVATINAWNRIGVSFRPEAGIYQPVAR